jgi:hypothetical protein
MATPKMHPESESRKPARMRDGWNGLIIFTGFAVGVAAVLLLNWPAQAQSGHERWHMYYQHWKQPGTTISCCNARTNTYGVESGDCEPTRYEMRNGEWYAWLRQEARWLHIPDDRIIRERNPSGEEGHLCWNQWTKQILCAVPPDTGG